MPGQLETVNADIIIWCDQVALFSVKLGNILSVVIFWIGTCNKLMENIWLRFSKILYKIKDAEYTSISSWNYSFLEKQKMIFKVSFMLYTNCLLFIFPESYSTSCSPPSLLKLFLKVFLFCNLEVTLCKFNWLYSYFGKRDFKNLIILVLRQSIFSFSDSKKFIRFRYHLNIVDCFF